MRELILDLDGCLVNTDNSYTRAAINTARELGAAERTPEDVYRLRSGGGFNDDYDVAREFLRLDGHEVDRATIIDVFQRYYLGRDWETAPWSGYITEEPLLAAPEFVSWLQRRRYSVFTGRPRDEAFYVLERLGLVAGLDHLVGMHDVANLKPHPEGLEQIITVHGYDAPLSCGDTLDDLRAASAAGIEFVGILPPAPSAREMMRAAFAEAGCAHVLETINDLPALISTRETA